MNQQEAFDKLCMITSCETEVEEWMGDNSLLITSFTASPDILDIQKEFGKHSLFFSGKISYSNSGLVLYF
jgi:hypothetical protein